MHVVAYNQPLQVASEIRGEGADQWNGGEERVRPRGAVLWSPASSTSRAGCVGPVDKPLE